MTLRHHLRIRAERLPRLRFLPSVLLVLAGGLPVPGLFAPGGGEAPVSAQHLSLRPDIDVLGASVQQRERLEGALSSFAALGLRLPDLTVRFSDDELGCAGHMGYFEETAQPWTVSVCSDLAFVYEHELAHAWEAANLTDDRRHAYLELRGLNVWHDKDTPWRDRGVEDAAFIIQQGLQHHPHPRLTPEMCARSLAFRFLTGAEPLWESPQRNGASLSCDPAWAEAAGVNRRRVTSD